MTPFSRSLSILLVAALASLSGCKKLQTLHIPGTKAADTKAPATPAPGGIAESPSSPPSSPPAPDAATVGAPPAAAPAAKGPIDSSASVIALCYHEIDDNSKSKALSISVAEFEHEMKEIKDDGFAVIGMQDFLAWRRGEKNIPHKSCLITIDDGWISAYKNAWPILKKYNYPFTLFIYIDYVGTGGRSMSWDQLGEMRDAGVDIESHTFSHSSLKSPGALVDRVTHEKVMKDVATLGVDGWLHKEIVESKEFLEKRLGIKTNVFAYPYGKYTEKAIALVKSAGYEAAFTVYGQRIPQRSDRENDKFTLGRYAIDTKDLKSFQQAMAMIGGGVSSAEPQAAMADFAAGSMVTEPPNNAVINNPAPKLMANLATMGNIEGTPEIRLSGIGPVPSKYDAASKTLTAQITQKLAPGTYSVIVSAKVNGQRAETRWDFKYDPAAKPSPHANPNAPVPPPNVLGR